MLNLKQIIVFVYCIPSTFHWLKDSHLHPFYNHHDCLLGQLACACHIYDVTSIVYHNIIFLRPSKGILSC